MTETYSGELSREAKLALSLLFPLIGRWRQRMESAPATPEADSSLFEDDLATFPYLVSQAVGAQLVSAADHWDALRMLVEDFHVVHARAPFTLLRGGRRELGDCRLAARARQPPSARPAQAPAGVEELR